MKKMIYVVDKKKSALHTAASARVTITGGKILIANEFRSPIELLESIYKENNGIILFCWRKAFADIISLKTCVNLYEKMNNNFTFSFLVPDHMGLELNFKKIESKMISACDYYVVTSKILFDEYCKSYPEQTPIAILHDLPNIQLIEKIRNEFPKKIDTKIKVIWVGNSKWGHRQGFKDHKGFEEFIKPLQSYISKHADNCTIEIIDSNFKYLDETETLKHIRDSDILIQVSKNEGTGLVILEALGLETNVITTKVGIVGELFEEDEIQVLSNIEISDIYGKIYLIINSNSTKLMRSRYEKYIKQAKQEKLLFFNKPNKFISSSSIKQKFFIYFYWQYRYFSKISQENGFFTFQPRP
jgi:hypothetical protein